MRHRGSHLQLFFLNIALASRTEFNVSKENVRICFNIIINAKYQKRNNETHLSNLVPEGLDFSIAKGSVIVAMQIF